MLHVLAPGLRSTIQDRGRFHDLRRAVPTAGPADPISFAAAQRLVGNTGDDAAIEIVGTPFECVFDEPRLIAVTGRDVSVRTRGTVHGWTSVFVRAGEAVEVVGGDRTRFAYLAVSGGITLEPVLRSRSTYLPGALGSIPRPLAAGDALPLGSARRGAAAAARTLVPLVRERIAVTRGPHADRFQAGETFVTSTYAVSEASDRTGVRLRGPALTPTAGEILSYGLPAGAVQVPRGGEPIVALADGGTTGGYPVIAVVIGADLGAVAQALPGEPLSFYEVDRRTAVERLDEVRRWLDTV